MRVWTRNLKLTALLLGLLPLLPTPASGQEPDPVVHALLFYSPTCPHCHEVINSYLIPLQNQYGSRLMVLGMDVSQSWANEIYWAVLQEYEVPEENWAVPLLVVEKTVLVGGFDIPDQFTPILEAGLESGGIDLPDLPVLLDFLEEQGVLDHRYPGRRMVAQPDREPAPAQEETPPPGGGSPAEEEVAENPTEDPATPPGDPLRGEAADSAAAPAVTDSAGAPEAGAAPVDPEPDASPPEASAGGGAGETPREEGDPGGAPAGESQGGGTEATSPPPGRASAAPAPAPEAAGTALGLQAAAGRMESMTMWERFQQDRTGNSISVLVLLGMVLSVFLTGWPGRVGRRPWPRWTIPILVVVGMGVAGYLSFIEVTHVEAVCGPVGDCNTVNQSAYATLFGFLPVGVLGLMGYAFILLLWALEVWGGEGVGRPAALGLWGATLFGVLFSIYLTFLEPFVIGATCAWCLSSAVIMTLLLWVAAPLASRVWPGGEEALPGEGGTP